MNKENNQSTKPQNSSIANQETGLDFQAIFAAIPGLYLVLTPAEFAIATASDAYFQATMTKREEVIGRFVFDVFPNNPNDPNGEGVKNLRASLENVLKYRKPHTIAIQKYDIRRLESNGSGFEERYWSLCNSPVFDANGEITYIINRVEDVTEFVRLRQEDSEQCRINQALQIRTEQVETEINVKAQESAQQDKQALWMLNEAAQRESEAKLRFVLDSCEIGEWDLDLTTQPYTAHRSLKHDQIFGYESLQPEWSYEIFLNHVHPDDRAAVDEKFQLMFATYVDWNFECRIIHPDQSIHYIWIRSSIYRSINGTPIRLLGVVVDITKRKQESETLRESERRFRRLVECNLFGISFGNCFGQLHYANEYLLNLIGYTREEFQSQQVRWDELTPHEFAGLDAKAVEQLTRRGVSEPYEKVYLHKNGRRIPILIAAALLNGFDDKNREVIAFILDLTELRRVSQERDRFFNLSLDMLAIGNLEGYFTQLNPAWEKVLGFTTAQLKAQPYIEFVHPDDRASTLIQAQKLASGSKVIEFENRYRTAYGSYRWISWNVVSLREQNIFYAAARDITNSKQIEIEREQLLCREQTAREAAERASRIKDEFLAVLSHELRSPLNLGCKLCAFLGNFRSYIFCVVKQVRKSGFSFR